MAISIERISLWRAEKGNTPGTLARTLAPLVGAGANFRVVMGYGFPADPSRAAIELFPVSGKRAAAAAAGVGLAASSIPSLLVQGDDRPGLGYAMTKALGEAGINLAFLVALAVGRKQATVLGFAKEGDLKRAVPLIRKTAAPPKKGR